MQAMFTKMDQIRHAFNMIWLMEILKIQQKELQQIRFCEIKHLKLRAIKKYDGYQRELASMVSKFFDKKSSGSGRPLSSASLTINNKQNIQLAKELYKPIIKN